MTQIKKANLDDLVQNHFEKLKSKIEDDFPSDCKYTLETILKAKPKKLAEIAQWFDSLSEDEQKDYEYINTSGYKNFSNKKKEYNAYDLAKSLNISACPYCNRNYTFTVTKSEEEILRPDIDHFYDKDSYPILALSFYNLIPSCIECNRNLKRTKPFTIDTHLHPYLDDFNSNARFNYKYKSTDKISIELKTDDANDTRTQNNIDDLKLKDIYNEGYQDIVQDLIQKSQIYNDTYIDELFTQYEGTLFKNREDLLRLITCGYINDEDIDKRPLSKLIKDISEELELI